MIITSHVAQIVGMLEGEVSTILDGLAEEVKLSASRMMDEEKHGAAVPWTNHGVNAEKGFVRTRSAPFEAPAVQTGQLQDSLHVESPDALTRAIGTDVEYGLYLELGTSKMAPRPYLRPALESVTGEMTVPGAATASSVSDAGTPLLALPESIG